MHQLFFFFFSSSVGFHFDALKGKNRKQIKSVCGVSCTQYSNVISLLQTWDKNHRIHYYYISSSNEMFY